MVPAQTQKGSLKELNLAVSYRSDSGNIVDQFYVPCLERASTYRRAVGYFTSSGLAVAARGLASFIQGVGTMFLVASPHLEEQDCQAITRGYEARHDVVTRTLVRCFDAAVEDIVRDRLACLAWLVANERLEIKVALPRTEGGKYRRGIYHEKLGLFTDDEGDTIAFSGSSNETAGGLVDNFESIDVFWSWEDQQKRVAIKEENFKRLWENGTPNLDILPFPQAAYEGLLRFLPPSPPLIDPESAHTRRFHVGPTPRPRVGFGVPEGLRLWDYQTVAMGKWFENVCRGIYEMATGTGKTVTALSSAVKLFDREHKLGVVILVPFQHLVDQWDEVARGFGLLPVKCYESTASWRETLADQVTDLNIGARNVVCAIATHKTSSSPPFADTIGRLQKPLLVIADEVHHLGAREYSKALIPAAKFRLGLSATPMRWLDPEGNSLLQGYFEKTVFSFPLEEAIEKGFLCHYDYHPHVVPLEPDEFDRYESVSLQVARIFNHAERDERARNRLDFLLRERAEILNCARGKLNTLRTMLTEPEQITSTLFYCAPGQIDNVVHLLANDLRMRVRRFTAEENVDERQFLLAEFEESKLQALVAMKCLDEGVDVPATRTAYILASSSNPREFIQRRGRILRLHPNKHRATIHDLIAIPPKERLHPEVSECERKLLRRELARFKEFASAADNQYQATEQIMEIAREYEVLDF
jgi:superfamily II DNA or RNA helicase